MGGNRLTAMNYTTSASNAGSDYLYENDAFFGSATPVANAVKTFITGDRSAGYATVMTFQLQGYVAADTAGACAITGTVPQPGRFYPVVYAKGSAFTTSPSTTGTVYMDEQAYVVDQYFSGQNVFGLTPTTYPVFANLDNEPDIWFYTHQEVQTATEIAYTTFFTNSMSLANALKAQYPHMQILGPAVSGFSQLYWWEPNGAVPGVTNTGYNWFVDLYCNAVTTANTAAGLQVIDAFDFHWYSHVIDPVTGNTIDNTNSYSLTDAQMQAIVQSTRSLWDPYFTENSYITQDTGIGPIKILPRFKDKIAHSGSNMKLAITEYSNGGGNSIAGCIAQADNLGIFGAQGVYLACWYPTYQGLFASMVSGFNAFRNFDGAGGNYGETSVATTVTSVATSTVTSGSANIAVTSISNNTLIGTTVTFSATVGTGSGQLLSGTPYYVIDQTSTYIQVSLTSGGAAITPNGSGTPNVTSNAIPDVAAYVSTSTTHTGRVVMVLINRSFAQQNTTVTGQTLTGTARIWRISASQVSGNNNLYPQSAGTQAASGSSITLNLPSLSITTVDIY